MTTTRGEKAMLELRLRNIANMLGKTDRILTSDPKIKVMALTEETAAQHGIGLDSEIPGFSQYPNIILNVSAFEEVGKTSTLVGLLGLNYHELSHLMFTPRGFKAQVVQNHPSIWGYAWNLLEDQRIESFFTALYEPAGKYFTETFVRFIMKDQSKWERIFLLSYGRGFLPLDFREEFEARFSHPHLIPEIKNIINEFKALKSFTMRINGPCYKLIRRMVDVLQEIHGEDDAPDCGGGEQGQGDVNSDAESEARRKERRRQRKEEQTGEDQSNFWEDEEEEDEEDEEAAEDTEDDSDGRGDSEGDESDSDDEDDGDSEGDDEGDSGDWDDSDEDQSDDGGESGDPSDSGDEDSETGGEDSDSSDDGADGDSGDNRGSGDASGMPGDDSDEDSEEGEEDGYSDSDDDESGGPAGDSQSDVEQQFSDEELREYLDEISEAIEGDSSVRDEVNRIYTVMNDDTNIDVIDFGAAPHRDVAASASSWKSIHQVKKQFNRLWADAEPGWKYGADSGKLNLDRALHEPDNFDEWFDEWDEGREIDLGLECVLALDMSSSMDGSPIRLASEAMWSLKRGLDELDAKVTVLGFHYATFGLYDRNKKIGKMVPIWYDLGGDTRPAHSMRLARTILSVSKMPNKLFAIITDGGWSTWDQGYDEADYPGILDSMPGTKMYVGVGSGAWSSNSEAQEHFDVRANISDPLDMVPLVEKTVKRMMEKRLHENRR